MAGISFDDLVHQYNYYKYRLDNYLVNSKERNLFDAAFQAWEDLKDTVESANPSLVESVGDYLKVNLWNIIDNPPNFEEREMDGEAPAGEKSGDDKEISPPSLGKDIKKKKLKQFKYKGAELKYLKKLIRNKKTPFELKGLAQTRAKLAKSEIQKHQIALLKKTKKRLLFHARKSPEFKLPYQERKSIGRGGYKYKNVEIKHLKKEAKALYRTLSKIKNKTLSQLAGRYRPPKIAKPAKLYMYTLEGEREGGKYISPSRQEKYLKNYEEGQDYIITRIPPKEYQRRKIAYEERFHDMYEDSILRGQKGALKGGGRPKSYKTEAEKQRAYRRRKKQKQ